MSPTVTPTDEPPEVLGLVGHRVRWRLLAELARSDRRVRELRDLVGQPQSLVSYHLGRLRAAGLVSTRRSTFDGRDTYYRVDLARCGDELAGVGASLHPALGSVAPPPPPPPPPTRVRSQVLFLCTGNSGRSPIAAALLERAAGDRMAASSAGSHPKPIHPNAVRVMAPYGVDLTTHRSKQVSTFTGRRFDCVISLCDRVREVCPEFPGTPETLHWSLPDPAAGGPGDGDTYPAFERTAAELHERIQFLIQRLDNDRRQRR